jgi:1-aminocyclopropane-1-carboxylate synthase
MLEPSEAYLGDYVHILWGLSKDWAASGLRVGVMLSHNAQVMNAFGNIGYFFAVSNLTQDALTPIAQDVAWLKSFFHINTTSLATAYDSIVPLLEQSRIPFTPACAGMFVWLDLRQFLSGNGFEAERALTSALWKECKLLFTPGEACHAPEAGFYRCCFAWMEPRGLQEGFRRLITWGQSRTASATAASP